MAVAQVKYKVYVYWAVVVVSELAFSSKDPSLNTTEAYTFFL